MQWLKVQGTLDVVHTLPCVALYVVLQPLHGTTYSGAGCGAARVPVQPGVSGIYVTGTKNVTHTPSAVRYILCLGGCAADCCFSAPLGGPPCLHARVAAELSKASLWGRCVRPLPMRRHTRSNQGRCPASMFARICRRCSMSPMVIAGVQRGIRRSQPLCGQPQP